MSEPTDVRQLWDLYKSIRLPTTRHDLQDQAKRTRAAIRTAVTELEILRNAERFTPDGHLDLDHLTQDTQ